VAKYSRGSILASLALSFAVSAGPPGSSSPGWVPKKQQAPLLRAAAAFYTADERYFTCQDPQQTTAKQHGGTAFQRVVESFRTEENRDGVDYKKS
jgi:hypothetical protein